MREGFTVSIKCMFLRTKFHIKQDIDQHKNRSRHSHNMVCHQYVIRRLSGINILCFEPIKHRPCKTNPPHTKMQNTITMRPSKNVACYYPVQGCFFFVLYLTVYYYVPYPIHLLEVYGKFSILDFYVQSSFFLWNFHLKNEV